MVPKAGARLGRGNFARDDCGNGYDRGRQQSNRTPQDTHRDPRASVHPSKRPGHLARL